MNKKGQVGKHTM